MVEVGAAEKLVDPLRQPQVFGQSQEGREDVPIQALPGQIQQDTGGLYPQVR
jgi:hypothetical protein